MTLTYVSCGLTLVAATTALWAAFAWRHRALVAERDLAELRADVAHHRVHQEARKLLIAEMVDARTRRN